MHLLKDMLKNVDCGHQGLNAEDFGLESNTTTGPVILSSLLRVVYNAFHEQEQRDYQYLHSDVSFTLHLQLKSAMLHR